jgi:hypothetical protein
MKTFYNFSYRLSNLYIVLCLQQCCYCILWMHLPPFLLGHTFRVQDECVRSSQLQKNIVHGLVVKHGIKPIEHGY